MTFSGLRSRDFCSVGSTRSLNSAWDMQRSSGQQLSCKGNQHSAQQPMLHVGQNQLFNSMAHQHVLLRLCLAHKDGLQVEIQKSTLEHAETPNYITTHRQFPAHHQEVRFDIPPHSLLEGQLYPLSSSFASVLTYDRQAEISALCSTLQASTLIAQRSKCCLPFPQEGRRQRAAVLTISINAQARGENHLSGTSSIPDIHDF